MPRSWDHYGRHADVYARRYGSCRPEEVHAAWAHLIPKHAGIALDVGAGSGRDAAWLARHGLEVVAVEPAAPLRERAVSRYGDERIRWIDDRLPSLERVVALDFRFDVVLLSAVWLHVAPGSRDRAFRTLANLSKPGGILVVTLRHGPLDPERMMHPTDRDELDRLARKHALEPVALPEPASTDFLGRGDVSWTTHVYRRPH